MDHLAVPLPGVGDVYAAQGAVVGGLAAAPGGEGGAGGLYRKLLQGRSRARAFAYGLTANAASALLGWYLAEPVWRWIVTIC